VTDDQYSGPVMDDPDDENHTAAKSRPAPGHGHGHSDHGTGPASPHARRVALAVVIPAAVITVIALVWLWPDAVKGPQRSGVGAQRVNGEVVAVEPAPCPAPPPGSEAPAGSTARVVVCGTAKVRLADGPDAGQEVTTDIPSGPGAPIVRAGDQVVLVYLPDTLGGRPYQIQDHQRGLQLWMLGCAFALAVIAFGRWRGVSALAGLAVTFAVLLLFIVPAILGGKPPLLVAIVGSAAIMLSVLYLTHGFTIPTSVAVVGTLASLTLTGLLSAVSTSAASLTGVASEDDLFLSSAYPGVNMQGLLLAGILIGSLGVLDDVAVTQAVTVTELAQANPAFTPSQLYRAATRVGRAHIASVVNTIILAYAGASLPLLLLISANNQLGSQILTNQLVAQEIVRSIVGTIGLIAAVPITTALAALTAHRISEHPKAPTGRRAGSRRDQRRRPTAVDWHDDDGLDWSPERG